MRREDSRETIKSMHLEKEVSKQDIIAAIGLECLPFLFGMSLVGIRVIANKSVVQSVGATPVTLGSLSNWPYMSVSMFLGAFVFSCGLFLWTIVFKKIVHGRFREIFNGASLVFAITSTLCLYVDMFVPLMIIRFVMGLAVGAICGVCPSYYMHTFGGKRGAMLCTIHGFLITVGIAIGNTIIDALESTGVEHRAFILMGVVSIISFCMTILTVRNSRSITETPEIPVVLSSDRIGAEENSGVRRDISYLLIVLCLIVHMVQQMTGINPILTEQDLIFAPSLTSKTVWAKHFFNFSGLIGSFICAAITTKWPAMIRWLAIGAGVMAAVSFIPLLNGPSVAGCWGAAFYYVFFSIGLANLPWMMPSMIIKDKQSESLAIGLGPLANWLISSIFVLIYKKIYHYIGAAVFIIFLMHCVLCGGLGWWLLTKYGNIPAQSNKNTLLSGAMETYL
ncbi:hypothetical protein NEOKW01_0240 [Nematocida sp. AWRm80]|nr:hypothetical protein NEOKW01_0240 [Nematocida sp. AWRm80]